MLYCLEAALFMKVVSFDYEEVQLRDSLASFSEEHGKGRIPSRTQLPISSAFRPFTLYSFVYIGSQFSITRIASRSTSFGSSCDILYYFGVIVDVRPACANLNLTLKQY